MPKNTQGGKKYKQQKHKKINTNTMTLELKEHWSSPPKGKITLL